MDCHTRGGGISPVWLYHEPVETDPDLFWKRDA